MAKGPFFDQDDAEDRNVDRITATKPKPTAPAPLPLDDSPANTFTPKNIIVVDALSEEELLAALARKRTAKIDAEIAALEQDLASKKAERDALTQPGALVPTFASTVTVKETGMQAKTPQPAVSRQKIKPGSLTREECGCKTGCYQCTSPS